MAAPLYYTAAMVRQLPDDGNRHEVVHGELLVTPAPRPWHQEVAVRLLVGLRGYCAAQGAGHVFSAPADISLGPDILVQPDVFVVPIPEARMLEWTAIRTLLLAVEVLSPSSSRADRFTKRRVYQEARVPLYWIVDLDERRVEVWTPDATFPTFETEQLVWHPAGAAEPFILSCNELFRPV